MALPISPIANNEAGSSVRSKLNEVIGYTNLQPLKIYRGYISQGNEAAPVFDSLMNTVGAVVWSRLETGRYVGTLAGAFLSPWLMINQRCMGGLVSADFYRIDDDSVAIDTYASGAAIEIGLTDGLLNAYIEIATY